jgi:hypothetical protein
MIDDENQLKIGIQRCSSQYMVTNLEIDTTKPISWAQGIPISTVYHVRADKESNPRDCRFDQQLYLPRSVCKLDQYCLTCY